MPGYAPAPGAGYGPPPTGGAGQPADLLMRFLARLIDFILVGIVNGIISAVVVVSILGMHRSTYGMGMGEGYAAGAITGVIGAAINLAYFSLMESRRGQTLGKMLLKLRTEGPDGNPPSGNGERSRTRIGYTASLSTRCITCATCRSEPRGSVGCART